MLAFETKPFVVNVGVTFSEDEVIKVGFETEADPVITYFEGFEAADVEYYKGSTMVTPSNSLQILNTRDKFLSEDIVVAPIPDNYGLISWNGSTLSVT